MWVGKNVYFLVRIIIDFWLICRMFKKETCAHSPLCKRVDTIMMAGRMELNEFFDEKSSIFTHFWDVQKTNLRPRRSMPILDTIFPRISLTPVSVLSCTPSHSLGLSHTLTFSWSLTFSLAHSFSPIFPVSHMHSFSSALLSQVLREEGMEQF